MLEYVRGIGIIGRDNELRALFFLAVARRFDGLFWSIKVAKALSIFYFIREASSGSLYSMEFESDVERVVNLINSEELVLNELNFI